MTRLDCHNVDERLMDFLYEELPPGDMDEVRAHLEGCTRCAAEVGRFQATRRTIQTLEHEEPSPAVSAKILHVAAGRKPKAARRRTRLFQLLVFGAAPTLAAAAALVLVFHAKERTFAPTPAESVTVAPPAKVNGANDLDDAKKVERPVAVEPAAPHATPAPGGAPAGNLAEKQGAVSGGTAAPDELKHYNAYHRSEPLAKDRAAKAAPKFDYDGREDRAQAKSAPAEPKGKVLADKKVWFRSPQNELGKVVREEAPKAAVDESIVSRRDAPAPRSVQQAESEYGGDTRSKAKVTAAPPPAPQPAVTPPAPVPQSGSSPYTGLLGPGAGRAGGTTGQESIARGTPGAKAPVRKVAAPAQAQSSGDEIYRQLRTSWNQKDCASVRRLAGELEKLRYDTQNLVNMKDAYEYRARCQASPEAAKRDRANASRLLQRQNQLDAEAPNAPQKAGKSQAVEKQ
jgi:hypothetical protein